MYIKTTLASETVNQISQIWRFFNEFSTNLQWFVYFAEHEKEQHLVLSLEDRITMLERILESIKESTIALTHLYSVDSVSHSLQELLRLVNSCQDFFAEFNKNAGYVLARALDWLTTLEGAISEISRAVTVYLEEARFITPMLMGQEQESLHEIFSTFDGRLDEFEPAHQHLIKAIRYLQDTPIDPENSIKEIVSTLESVGRVLYPNANTLGDVVKAMKKDQSRPQLLITVIEKFYAYASAEPAIRHGALVSSKVVLDDAEFCLHVGSALTRYLIASQKHASQ
jgi:hypothetical protein